MDTHFISVEQAVDQIKSGKILIVVDDDNRENEGDFIIAADKVTPDSINYMAKYGRGLICQAITEQRAKELNLNPMVETNSTRHGTAFTVSVDARDKTTTGISAFDRAQTVNVLIDPDSTPDHLLRPGHIFPLIARNNGVLSRDGHTEATIDLARLAGCYPSGVLCEIMDDNGKMAKLSRLVEISQETGIKIFKISDLIEYRKKISIQRKKTISLPTSVGEFELILFENSNTQQEPPFALRKNTFKKNKPVLVRVHSECLTGETLLSQKCDCGFQLQRSMRLIQKYGGIIVYLRQEGRGIGFANKIKAYALQEEGYDTVDANHKLGFEADERDYTIAANILKDLNVTSVRLLTNNPEKIQGLKANGITVTERVPLEQKPQEKCVHYMVTKKNRMGHILQNIYT